MYNDISFYVRDGLAKYLRESGGVSNQVDNATLRFNHLKNCVGIGEVRRHQCISISDSLVGSRKTDLANIFYHTCKVQFDTILNIFENLMIPCVFVNIDDIYDEYTSDDN